MALSKIESQALDVGQIGGRRNLIINGAMQVAQRGNTTNDNGVFVADRFEFKTNGLGAAGAVIAASTQSTVVPSGFASALKTNVTTAGSGFAADARDGFSQKLEHQDVTHLVDAGNSFTVSFWCRSSLATTYGFTVWLGDRDTASGGNVYATTYTINTANTWEYKTIVIPAVSSSRSGGTDNLRGMQLYWALELISGGTRGSATADAWSDSDTSDQVTAAATNTGWMSSTNDFYITGVQLEVGTVATPFEHRSYGEELALCQRYYQKIPSTRWFLIRASREEGSTNDAGVPTRRVPFATVMRNTPALTFSNANVTSNGPTTHFAGFHGNTSVSAGQSDYRTTDISADAEL